MSEMPRYSQNDCLQQLHEFRDQNEQGSQCPLKFFPDDHWPVNEISVNAWTINEIICAGLITMNAIIPL